MNLMNSSVMQQFNTRDKDDFQKNKYKFEGMGGGRIGKEKNGFLEITKKDIGVMFQKEGVREEKKEKKRFHKKKGKKKRK